MTEATIYDIILYAWVGVAVLAFASLFFITAPYGRHARTGFGPKIDSTLGWILMEAPSPVLMAVFFATGDRLGSPTAWVFLLIWELHYVNRAFVFPFRRRGKSRPMPLAIALSGFFFNVVNAYLQGRFLFALGPVYDSAWLLDPRFLAGLALFLAGFGINLHSDAILRRLRAPGETGYRIPHGGLYRWISSPNYFGETLEWCGWALLTWSMPGLVFAFWTFANLAPRARDHHRWYRDTFPDYPPDRRAFIPYVM